MNIVFTWRNQQRETFVARAWLTHYLCVTVQMRWMPSDQCPAMGVRDQGSDGSGCIRSMLMGFTWRVLGLTVFFVLWQSMCTQSQDHLSEVSCLASLHSPSLSAAHPGSCSKQVTLPCPESKECLVLPPIVGVSDNHHHPSWRPCSRGPCGETAGKQITSVSL